MRYSKWKFRDVAVGSLLFDKDNARIPGADQMSQSELWHHLIEEENALAIAKSIAADGYFPTEPVVAIQEGKKLVITEGNRRLAAVKGLFTPDGVPEKFKARFRALNSTLDTAAIKKIPTWIAPNRAQTIPLIKSRHTDSATQPKNGPRSNKLVGIKSF